MLKGNNMNKITNRATIEIDICGRRHVIETAETTVEPVRIEFESVRPCRFYVVGHPIEYKFRLRNESDSAVYDLRFASVLTDASYVDKSFAVNNCHVVPTVNGHAIEYVIPQLRAHETATITFEALPHHHTTAPETIRPCQCAMRI